MKKLLLIIALLSLGIVQAQETHNFQEYEFLLNIDSTTRQAYITWCADSIPVGRRYYITKDLYKDVYFIPSHPGYKKYNTIPKHYILEEPIMEPREVPSVKGLKNWLNLKKIWSADALLN